MSRSRKDAVGGHRDKRKALGLEVWSARCAKVVGCRWSKWVKVYTHRHERRKAKVDARRAPTGEA